MNKEIKDKLLEFAIYGDYKISFDDAVHFVIKFLDNQGIEVTDTLSLIGIEIGGMS